MVPGGGMILCIEHNIIVWCEQVGSFSGAGVLSGAGV